MARFRRPSSSRSTKFEDRLNKLDQGNDFALVGSRGGQALVKALSKFLNSIGSKVVRLSGTSRKKLLQQDSTSDQLMREQAIDALNDRSRRQIKAALESYIQEKTDHKALRAQLTGIVKRQTLAAAIIGVRGVGNLTDNVLTAVKRQLSVQLGYLDGFLSDIETRSVTAKDRARAAQYANSNWAISQTAARQFNLDSSGISAAQLEEKRNLGGAEHCDDCIELAGEWEEFGSLPPIGQGTVCGSNCRCSFEYRQKNEETSDSTQTTNEAPVKNG